MPDVFRILYQKLLRRGHGGFKINWTSYEAALRDEDGRESPTDRWMRSYNARRQQMHKDYDHLGRVATANECDSAPMNQTPEFDRDVASAPEPRKVPDVLRDLFTYHSPSWDQVRQYNRIRETALLLARAIEDCVPYGVDRRSAILTVSEAVMIANRGIATRGVANLL